MTIADSQHFHREKLESTRDMRKIKIRTQSLIMINLEIYSSIQFLISISNINSGLERGSKVHTCSISPYEREWTSAGDD